MNIEIWSGSCSFSPGQTPFGFYDSEAQFSADADKVAVWAAKRLGYPLVSVELQSGSFYAAFEEAITVYSNEVYQYKIRENYGSLEGNSVDVTLNDKLITPSLGTLIRIGQTYGAEAGAGGKITYHTGSIDLGEGVQEYDLNQWAEDNNVSGSIEIKRIFYENTPAAARFYDPYAGSGGSQILNDSFGMANGGTAIMNSMLMPLNYDVMRAQSIEFGDDIRRSAYSFDLINNQLRIFPIPTRDFKLYFHYIETRDRDSAVLGGGDGTGGNGTDLVTDISKVPYTNPVYSTINSVGKQFIFQYTLGIAKEMLGYIRKKFTSIPIPGSEVTLNGDDLINAAIKEKDALLEQLRDTLNETSRKAQLERQKLEGDALKDVFSNIPMPFYIF